MYIMPMYSVSTYQQYPKLIARMVEIGLRQADLAVRLGIHPTLFNAYLRGRRAAPSGFEALVNAELDLQAEAKRAGAEAERKVLESAVQEAQQKGERDDPDK